MLQINAVFPEKGVLNENLLSWLSEQDEANIDLSVITIAEIMRGVAKLDDGKKKVTLYQWVQKEIPRKFLGRILDFEITNNLFPGVKKLHYANNGIVAL